MILAKISLVLLPLALAACAQEALPPPPASDPGAAAGTRPAGEPQLFTVTGTIVEGVECSVIETDDGRKFAFNDEQGLSLGDRVRIIGEMADASFCMEGEGTIIPTMIEPLPAD